MILFVLHVEFYDWCFIKKGSNTTFKGCVFDIASPCLLLVAREYWRIGPFFVKA
jgi:hypothetical protein